MAAHSNPLTNPEVRQGTALRYIAAFIASAVAMYAAYAIALQKPPLVELVEVLAGALLFSLVTQVFLVFGLNLSPSQIWKSVTLVLTVPLFIITVGLTVWAFSSLYNRTMPDPSMLSAMSM